MPSLFHTLNMGSEALYTTRQGVDTTGHNIANAQTEGFSRQRVNIQQREPLDIRSMQIGNGVYVGSITRSHDKFIENQIVRANQEGGRAATRAEALKGLEVIFSPELKASVTDEMNSFFGSLQELANFPEDFTVRTNVVESAKNVVASFRRVDQELSDNRVAINEKVLQTTTKVSDTCREIADLNQKIQEAECGQNQNANDLRDQRDRLVRNLSKEVDIHYYEDKNGQMLVRGPKEVTLVEGSHAARLDVVGGSDGMYQVMHVDWQNGNTRDITNGVEAGSLHALLQIRDRDLTGLLAKNNEMAYTFANKMNETHQMGYGLKSYAEQQGRNFFKPPADLATAARYMDLDDVINESNEAIAAGSSPFAPGDNVVVNQMIKLRDTPLFNDGQATINDFYANYVGAVGLEAVRADHVKEASDIMMDDLNKRRESVSGVSLDEEATNLMKWQTCFTANSKVITTVDEMLETVLSLKR